MGGSNFDTEAQRKSEIHMRHCLRFHRPAFFLILLLPLFGCQTTTQTAEQESSAPAAVKTSEESLMGLTLDQPVTIPDVGAAQGLEWRDGRVYIYGDRTEGMIREYRLRGRSLDFTGLEMMLTLDGKDTISHPTGLTWQKGFGTWLGDTVNGQGTIYHLDWDALQKYRTLDGAVLKTIADDLAVNGTRPEFVRFEGKWYLATADYGDKDNVVRLYDPEKLAQASRTSDEGVLAHSFSCGPWVQSLYWDERAGALMLVQNQVEGLKWRVSLLDLEASVLAGHSQVLQVTDLPPQDELEGFHEINSQLGIFVSSSRENNLYFADLAWAKVR